MTLKNKFRFLLEGLKARVFDYQYVSQFADRELMNTNQSNDVFINLSLSKTDKESIEILDKFNDSEYPNQIAGIKLCELLFDQASSGLITERELVEKGHSVAYQTGMNKKILKDIDDLECNLFQAEDGIVPKKIDKFKSEILEYFKNIKTYANNV